MNELTERMKIVKEAMKNGFIEKDGKKYYHRISYYYLSCDSCPVQQDCDYTLSGVCMEYENQLKTKGGMRKSFTHVMLFLTERPHMKVEIAESEIAKFEILGRHIDFYFKDGCWVCIGLAKDKTEVGYWEIQSNPKDDDSYSEGGLWFNGEQIQDYDGCYDLPKHVKTALSFLGYHIDE